MTQDEMDYFAGEISQLLNTRIEFTRIAEVVKQEGQDRINNAITRAHKDEAGALKFLQNCFPVEHARGFVNQQQRGGYSQNNMNSNGNNQRQQNDDMFPADQNRQNQNNQNSNQNNYSNSTQPTQQQQEQHQEPASQEPETDNSDADKFIGHHIYGGKGALYVAANYKEKHDLHTIAVEGAPSAGIRKYDWNKKIRLQLTREELPHFFAVITGMMPTCKLSNHGAGHNKALELKDQGDSWFTQIYGPNQNIAVKITASDALYVAQIVMRQMLLNAPWLDSTGILNLVRMIVANRTVKEPHKQQQQGGRR